MHGASPIGEEEALISGKTPCPVCNNHYVGALGDRTASWPALLSMTTLAAGGMCVAARNAGIRPAFAKKRRASAK